MFAHGQTIISYMEQFAPKYYAMPDDPIGLQLGSLDRKVERVLVALDVTKEVVKEAIEHKVGLIIAHHAIMYRPAKHLRTDLPAGKLYESLIKNDVAIYIAHTNLDVARGGVNDILAEALQLQGVAPIRDVHTEKLYKLVVFVPESHQEKVRDALFNSGAGSIGDYSHCSFNVEGIGTFLPKEGTNPYIGQTGRLEQVKEIRIETIVPDSVRSKAIQAMLKAHPYEEVAYDLYPMDLKGRALGIGRIGKLSEPQSLRDLAQQVKTAFDVPCLRMVGQSDRIIRKVAIVGGSGRDYVKDAIFAGADVLITGDINYHTAHDALSDGLCLIDAGHNIEKLLKPVVAQILGEKLRSGGYATDVIASKINTEPFKFI